MCCEECAFHEPIEMLHLSILVQHNCSGNTRAKRGFINESHLLVYKRKIRFQYYISISPVLPLTSRESALRKAKVVLQNKNTIELLIIKPDN